MVAAAGPEAPLPRRLPLVEQFLREQQSMTAVERFAQRHGAASAPLLEGRYRDLLPASPPAAGQQYAFEVDLDACTGCKACVTACHNLNGLDEGEAWRSVGLLHGGTVENPVQQTITTACHHCLDPACMNGCPVNAYEKDPITGIVKHLDDQCIGCQYCTFTCPYDVPQYNAERGIVRKCDMCSDRLAVGEAPACVQACPNEAISIAIVEVRRVLEDAQVSGFLPGAAPPEITLPTTAYKTDRVLPRNLLPANFYAARPAHEHRPLVVMLVLTQLSAGAFWVDAVGARFLPRAAAPSLGSAHALVAMAIGLVALAASVLHLGRPLYAFRALLGLRTSWVSREILAFGLFAPLAMLYAASFWVAPACPLPVQGALRAAVALAGAAGVFCSVLIYHATRRVWWAAPTTGFKFLMTAAVLGLATTEVTLSLRTGALGLADHATLAVLAANVARLIVAVGLCKGLVELAVLRHLRDRRYADLRRTAVLLTRDLSRYTFARLVCLVFGLGLSAIFVFRPPSILLATLALVFLTCGELLERMLFFAASCARNMPGGLDA
jgi:formate dehydrogenase iron-sulfur subunit